MHSVKTVSKESRDTTMPEQTADILESRMETFTNYSDHKSLYANTVYLICPLCVVSRLNYLRVCNSSWNTPEDKFQNFHICRVSIASRKINYRAFTSMLHIRASGIDRMFHKLVFHDLCNHEQYSRSSFQFSEIVLSKWQKWSSTAILLFIS